MVGTGQFPKAGRAVAVVTLAVRWPVMSGCARRLRGLYELGLAATVGRGPVPAKDAKTQDGRAERGQISLLIIGFTIIALLLIIGAVDVTAVQLARVRLFDAADGAALDASDALDNGSAYAAGLR